MLSIPMNVRILSQPRASPGMIALARGPLVYCVEDIDNGWVKDHFKSVHLDTKSTSFSEERCDDTTLGEHYVAIKATGGIYEQCVVETTMPGAESVTFQPLEASDEKMGRNELRFVPYYLRANRGGRGQMRVGLKQFA